MADHAKLFSAISHPPVQSVRSESIQVGGVHFFELREVAALQKRSVQTSPGLWLRHPASPLEPPLRSLSRCPLSGGAHRRLRHRRPQRRPGSASSTFASIAYPAAAVSARSSRSLDAAIPEGDIIPLVETENETPPKALYRREGFKEVGLSRNYYGRGLDGIWMQKVRDNSSAHKIRI